MWADNQPLAQIDVTTKGKSRTEQLIYLHTDHLNTPRLATDATQTKVWSWEGNAFGDSVPNEDPDRNHKTTTVNLRFAGQYFDAESGLIYNGANYYDPKTGRWLTPDGMSIAAHTQHWRVNNLGVLGEPSLESNPYVRVRNNPLRFIDPTGFWSVTVGGYFGIGGEVTFGNSRTSTTRSYSRRCGFIMFGASKF